VRAPFAGEVHGEDRVRGVEDVGSYGLADVPAVGGGAGYVVEQLVPLGDLVTGFARAGADGAGVEAAGVGQDGGDFVSFQGGYSVPVGSSRAASRAAMCASVRVMPGVGGAGVPPGRA
jgi:hypothetical protein